MKILKLNTMLSWSSISMLMNNEFVWEHNTYVNFKHGVYLGTIQANKQ